MYRYRTIAVFLLLLLVFSGVAFATPVDSARGGILILFDRYPADKDIEEIRGLGGNLKYRFQLIPGLAVANLPVQACNGLLKNPHVVACADDGEVQALDAELDNTWGVRRIGAGTVHDSGNTGAGVKVAVVDTGVDYIHSELTPVFAGGYDFVNRDSNPMDDNGHGTHVAGTVAALKNAAGVVGVSPSVSLYGLKVLNSSGSGRWSDIIAALDWAVQNGIQVANHSYGSSSNPGATVEAAFNAAETAGIVNVAAAGNSGNCKGKNSNVNYPAKFVSVIAVAATNQNDARACFSSTGSEVELAAPGVKIKSTKLGGGYTELSGTSMASPHVSGAAALVFAEGVTDSNGNSRVNDEVRKILQQTAQDLGVAGRDTHYGFGLVNAAGAAAAAQ